MGSGTSNLAAAAIADARGSQLIELSADIVSALCESQRTERQRHSKLIATVHAALSGLGGAPEPEAVVELRAPAVPVKKSITPDYLICLEDGKKFKSLKRHLRTEYDMSPEEYRAKWGLPVDYPMVAPTYSRKRVSLAKTIGLGRKPNRQPPAGAPRSFPDITGGKQTKPALTAPVFCPMDAPDRRPDRDRQGGVLAQKTAPSAWWGGSKWDTGPEFPMRPAW